MTIAIIVIAIVVVLVLGLYFSANYLYSYCLNPRKRIRPLKVMDESLSQEEKTTIESTILNGDWFRSVLQYETYITSFDGLKLHSYIIENDSDKWVIVQHGYKDSADRMLDYARNFHSMGYNVLLPDARWHGKSEGSYIGLGWHDRLDIMKWIDYINQNNDDVQIVLFGVSMGASTMMMISGERLPTNVRCIIEDSGYTSICEQLKYQLKSKFNIPSFPILNVANIICKVKNDYNFYKEGSSIEQIKKCTIPMLFIHGGLDSFVPFYMLQILYNSATCEKEKMVIEGAKHIKGASLNPEKYWGGVSAFLNRVFADL